MTDRAGGRPGERRGSSPPSWKPGGGEPRRSPGLPPPGTIGAPRPETAHASALPLPRLPARPRRRPFPRNHPRVPPARYVHAGHRYRRRRPVPPPARGVDRRHEHGALPGREPAAPRRVRPTPPVADLLPLVAGRALV